MYLIVGANGYLGSYITKALLTQTDERIFAVCRNLDKVWTRDARVEWISADISKAEGVDSLAKLVNLSPEPVKVVFLAATHQPDIVENDPDAAWNVNVVMLERFLNEARNIKCLFYPSTDSVYGDSIDGYHFKEDDELRPVNTYGRQKIAAEQAVRAAGYNVVRYPFLAGFSLLSHKKHFCDVIAQTILDQKPIELFCDSYRSSLDFAAAGSLLVRLCESYSPDYPKTLNVCGDDDLSKYDVGLIIARLKGADEKYVVPLKMADDSGIFVTKRAQSTLLDNSLLKKTLGIKEIHLTL